MSTVRLRITIAPDHTISGTAPPGLPPGEHEVVIEVSPSRPYKPFRYEGFPIVDAPWDDSVSLRREDMYGDDGR